nr:EAL domain-containing protein [Octadecabacter dasysiphoniae]
MVIAFFVLRQSAPLSSTTTQWGVAAGFLVLFLYSSIDTLRQHLTTEADLFKAERESKQRLAQLEESHRLDTLTGILNRRAFDVALDVMLEDRNLTGGEITVFLVDLDSFKPINDTYSHEAGDEVLIQTAERLQALIGQSGIVGRLGGDEFVCAVHDLGDTDGIMEYGVAIARTIARPIHWNARSLKIVASVGAAATGGGHLPSVQALCSAADQAMFAAKSSPSGAPVLYQPHLFAPRMTAENKQLLIESISDRSLKPYYQPKIHLPTGQIIGFEALARWERGPNEIHLPSEFIDQIDELGLQGDLMMSIANQVVGDINTMLNAGLDPGQVSLNVSEVALATYSGRQDLKNIVADNPDAAKHLTFEITEDVFIARAADTIQASIASFRELGVRISLDDFGTGFASFHHLRQLDFDELKIDTSFVAGLGHDPTAEVLVRGFLNIASGLGVSVVAEGVETQAQSRDLINMGCITAQGFLFSPAVAFAPACQQLQDQKTTLGAL